MNRYFVTIGLLLPIGCLLSATPTIGPTTATPTTVAVGHATTLTITSVITDPSLITTSVNLLRLNPGSSPTIVGQLHDDGLNGDATAGDHTYTIQVLLNQPATGSVQYEVSAAFKGVLQRVLSTVMTVSVVAGAPTISASVSPPPNGNGWNNSTVTVTFTCSDSVFGVASCPAPVTVAAEGANQVISGTATNKAGVSASTSVTVSIDETPPTVKATSSPPPNAAGWNDSNVTVSFTCSDSLSGIASCPAPVSMTAEGVNEVSAPPAVDLAGNTAAPLATILLDKTAPIVQISSPANQSNLFSPQSSVNGTVGDSLSGVSGVTCNGSVAQLNGSNFSCNVSLNTGPGSITVQTVDVAGNTSSATVSVTVIPAPVVAITSPANLSFTNINVATIRGTVSDPNATVSVNGVSAGSAGGNFTVQVPLVEGSNTLTAVAQNAGGNQGSASVIVTLDTTPPHVTVTSPLDGSTVTDSSLTVTGNVNDVVVGTVNDQDAQVTVNGIAALVSNRTYAAPNVPLAVGPNTIQVVARDRVGNAATTNVSVTRVSASQPPAPAIGKAVIVDSLNIVSGNNQTAVIGSQLPIPLAVVFTDTSGNPIPSQPVVFRVTQGNGLLSASGSGGSFSAVVRTDAGGRAQVFWTLGQRAGAATNAVDASTVLAIAPVHFSAIAQSGPAAQIVVDSGDNQTGIAGQSLTYPLVAVVTDAGHNRVANVPVTFTSINGGGTFNGVPNQVITTDSDGRALAVLTLGPNAGPSNHTVEASYPGATSPIAFTASAKIPGDPSLTTISGVVLDNSNNPIPNVTIRLFQTNQGSNNNLPIQIGQPVTTGIDGRFTIQKAPVGTFKLMADGTTAGNGSSSYPPLEYDLITVAGNDNTVGSPIYLPVLDSVNKLCVDETHGGTLKLPQSPGFSLTVAPGSATFPGGTRSGCISVSPVNGDKVPMAPGFGQQPRYIVTIQPVGTTFNPPAAMTLPNVDGLPARAKTEMYSYDHDLSMFVAIGTATVSADGSQIISDPGVGVIKAGWHCGGDPNANGHVADCGACKICTGNSCAPDPNAQACNQPDNVMTSYGVQLYFDDSCKGACQLSNGSCAPSAGGFSFDLIRQAAQKALSKVFDNSQTACLGNGLRAVMQPQLQQLGIYFQCSTTSKDCGSSIQGDLNPDTNLLPRTNTIEIGTRAMTGDGCPSGPDGLASVILHEMMHAYALDPGAPTEAYHNQTDGGLGGNFTRIIDCRDRVYGCQESCFPGSTQDKNFGNRQSCLLPQGSVTCSGSGAEYKCAAAGCGLCDRVSTGDVICNTAP